MPRAAWPRQVPALLCHAAGCGGTCAVLESLRAALLWRAGDESGAAEAVYAPDTNAKHTPFLSVSGGAATVHVGPPENRHPTDPAAPHFIDAIYVADQTGAVVAAAELSPTGVVPPVLQFAVPASATELTPYEHCNKHGLFRGDPVTVAPAAGAPAAACTVTPCLADTQGAAGGRCAMFGALRAELLRRQHGGTYTRQGGDAVYDVAAAAKHTPVAVATGAAVRVTVGTGTVTGDASLAHGQHDPTDPDKIHFIESIFATDQHDAVIALSRLSAFDDPPVLEFAVPPGTTQVTPYEYCNRHGLFRGDTIPILSAGELLCTATRCHASAPAAAPAAGAQPPAVAGTPDSSAPSPSAACTPSDLAILSRSGNYKCMVEPLVGFTVHWQLDEAAGSIHVALRSSGATWLGLAVPEVPGTMVPADIVIGNEDGKVTRMDGERYTSPPGAASTGLWGASAESVGGALVVRFARNLSAKGVAGGRAVAADGSQWFHAARDPHPASHADNTASFALALRDGVIRESGGTDKNFGRLMHGLFMILGFLVLFPTAALFKRHGSFKFHVSFAILGWVIVLASAIFAYSYWWTPLQCFPFVVPETAGTDTPEWCDGTSAHAHAAVGQVLLFLVVLMPFIGATAPLCCPTKEHKRRWIFRLVHPMFGRFLLRLGVIQVVIGLYNMAKFDGEVARVLGLLAVSIFVVLIAVTVWLERQHSLLELRDKMEEEGRQKSASNTPGSSPRTPSRLGGSVSQGGPLVSAFGARPQSRAQSRAQSQVVDKNEGASTMISDCGVQLTIPRVRSFQVDGPRRPRGRTLADLPSSPPRPALPSADGPQEEPGLLSPMSAQSPGAVPQATMPQGIPRPATAAPADEPAPAGGGAGPASAPLCSAPAPGGAGGGVPPALVRYGTTGTSLGRGRAAADPRFGHYMMRAGPRQLASPASSGIISPPQRHSSGRGVKSQGVGSVSMSGTTAELLVATPTPTPPPSPPPATSS